MFGLDDNDSKTQNNSDDKSANSTAAPPNPFGAGDTPQPSTAPELSSQADSQIQNTSNASPDDSGLLDIKQQALQKLQPLVSHLDQSPEEKFKTTMMLIQANDDSSLVKQAYEAANQISDEKARAQALLDVVNEINYFTHRDGEAKT